MKRAWNVLAWRRERLRLRVGPHELQVDSTERRVMLDVSRTDCAVSSFFNRARPSSDPLL